MPAEKEALITVGERTDSTPGQVGNAMHRNSGWVLLTTSFTALAVLAGLWVVGRLCSASLRYRYGHIGLPRLTQLLVMNPWWPLIAASMVVLGTPLAWKRVGDDDMPLLRSTVFLLLTLITVAFVIAAVAPWLPVNPGLAKP